MQSVLACHQMLPKLLLSCPHPKLSCIFKGKKSINRFMYIKDRRKEGRKVNIRKHDPVYLTETKPCSKRGCTYRVFKMSHLCPPWGRLSQIMHRIMDMSQSLPTIPNKLKFWQTHEMPSSAALVPFYTSVHVNGSCLRWSLIFLPKRQGLYQHS